MFYKRFYYLTLASILLLITYNALAEADQNRWTSSGPEGARVVSIILDPTNNHRILIGAIEDGIYQSTDMGNSWTILAGDSLDPQVHDVYINPNNHDTVIAGTERGLFISGDGGSTWHRPVSGWSINPASRIASNPQNPNVILAVGDWTHRISTDGGANWHSLELHSMVLTDVIFHPVSPDTAYVSTQGGIEGLSVYKSSDYGATWYCVHNNLDSNIVVWDLAIDNSDPRILYAAGDNYYHVSESCIQKTIDGGLNWFDVSPSGLRYPMVISIAISPFNHDLLFAGTRYDGVIKSTDGGLSWISSYNGLQACAIATIVVDSISGVIYAGTFYDGIYRSSNNGDNWYKISTNINSAECLDISANWRSPESVYVATRNGLYRSVDSTGSWQCIDINYPTADRETYIVQVDPINPNRIFVAFMCYGTNESGRMHWSTDGGNTWNDRGDGLPANFEPQTLRIVSYPDSSEVLYLTTSLGLYSSYNLGERWDLATSGLPTGNYFYAIGINENNPDIVYTGDLSGNLYRTFDGGLSWNSVTSPPIDVYIHNIVCDPTDPAIIYVTMETLGLYKSTDSGVSWTNLTGNLPVDTGFTYLTGLAINPENPENLYVNSYYRGFFVSNNGGQTWESLSEGLPRYHIGGFTLIDPTDTSHIYLASLYNSVWSIRRNIDGINNGGDLPNSFSLFPNYPNPFNSSTTIRYSIPIAGPVTLDIYDILGRKVQTLIDIQQQAGEHQVIWEADKTASGLYFYRMQAGDKDVSRPMILLK
jgi:photosystem II stability/assembly factor-like uncharacterized protein